MSWWRHIGYWMDAAARLLILVVALGLALYFSALCYRWLLSTYVWA